jgi:hypothetical protein
MASGPNVTRPATSLCLFAVLTAVFIALQLHVGANHAERASFPDEAAHFMNGLLVRDYLRHGLPGNPFAFAANYYLHFPKIAPLVWPPLFHGVLGVFLLPGWPPHAAALVLVAMITAWSGWRLFEISRLISGIPAALVVCGLFVSTSLIVDLTSVVMVDMLVVACLLEATYWLARFFATGQNKDAIAFGAFAALACMTKGNGLAIVAVPALLVLFTGRTDMLRRPGMYIGATIVAVIAVPFTLISYRFGTLINDYVPVTASTVLDRARFYLGFLNLEFGPLMLALTSVGVIASIRPWSKSDRAALQPTLQSALAALAIASLAFHLVVPHKTMSPRYLLGTIVPLLALAPCGATLIAGASCPARWRRQLTVALTIIAGAVMWFMEPPFTARTPQGWRQTAHTLGRDDQVRGRRILVVSDDNGEGGFVSEMAGLEITPPVRIIRGSKLLASDDWNGNHFRMTFASPRDVLQELEDLHTEYVVLDRSAASTRLAYWNQVSSMLTDYSSRFDAVDISASTARPISVYKLRFRSEGVERALRIRTSDGAVLTDQSVDLKR